MARMLALLFTAVLAAYSSLSEAADPASDAPEVQGHRVVSFKDAASYQDALQVWRSPEDVNAWIGARFLGEGKTGLRVTASALVVVGIVLIAAGG